MSHARLRGCSRCGAGAQSFGPGSGQRLKSVLGLDNNILVDWRVNSLMCVASLMRADEDMFTAMENMQVGGCRSVSGRDAVMTDVGRWATAGLGATRASNATWSPPWKMCTAQSGGTPVGCLAAASADRLAPASPQPNLLALHSPPLPPPPPLQFSPHMPAEVFACTVGQKPSKAPFYVNDPGGRTLWSCCGCRHHSVLCCGAAVTELRCWTEREGTHPHCTCDVCSLALVPLPAADVVSTLSKLAEVSAAPPAASPSVSFA